MGRYFKGGKFKNRYKITGKLTALSPLHIGDGTMESDQNRFPKDEKDNKDFKYSTVMTDVNGRAYIPGSTIKGNLRHWVEQLLTDFSDANLACINSDARIKRLDEIIKKKKQSISFLHEALMVSEYIFGSNVNEGKLEFWDAHMDKPPTIPETHCNIAYSGYSDKKGTIIMKSVAIDPSTGTAAKNLLYNYEVVPRGAVFNLTVTGQNLTEDELGMLFFVLEGFNSAIYPVTLGAMGGIGFGRFKFLSEDIHCLTVHNLKRWLENALNNSHAGYAGLDKLPEEDRNQQIKQFKDSFLSCVKGEM